MAQRSRPLASSRSHQLRTMLEKRYRELGAQLKDVLHERRRHEWKLRSSTEGVEEIDPGELELAIAELKADMRRRVAAALSRLAEGSYGRCESCGLDIAIARLEAMPFALRCRDCEAVREASQKPHGARGPRGGARPPVEEYRPY